MRRLLTMVLLLLLSPLLKAASEQASWSCQGLSSVGFMWQNNEWQDQAFAPANYLFTIAAGGRNATLIFSGIQWSFDNCQGSNIIRCSSSVGNTIVMNSDTGQAAVSSIVANAVPPEEDGASSFIERMQCRQN